MEGIWDINKIQEILPQRYPFLFIDKVLEINEPEGKAVCLKAVTINEDFFRGHFPDNPVVPAVIIIEAMAQSSIILYAALKPVLAAKHPDYYLGKVEAKFFKAVRAGDCLRLEVEKEKVLDTGGITVVMAKVDGGLIAKARISFSVRPKSAVTDK